MGIFQVLYLNRSPEDAYAPLAAAEPYMPFRDASCGIPTFNLQPIDCIRVRFAAIVQQPNSSCQSGVGQCTRSMMQAGQWLLSVASTAELLAAGLHGCLLTLQQLTQQLQLTPAVLLAVPAPAPASATGVVCCRALQRRGTWASWMPVAAAGALTWLSTSTMSRCAQAPARMVKLHVSLHAVLRMQSCCAQAGCACVLLGVCA